MIMNESFQRDLKARDFLIIVSVSLLLVLPGMLPSSVLAAPDTTLTIGGVVTPPSTYVQTPGNWGGGNSITQIPYLYCYQYGSGGIALPDLCHVPAAVPGSNDSEWVVN